jgi:manganese/zinc/iron transport system permease protein
MSHAAWIILTGCVVGTSCAVLGCFLVLRKIAMLGDAISHAVLPGIVLAFLITASRSSLPMFIGAVAIGGLTAFVVQYLSEKGVQGDAAIGVTFTSLFAIGVVLVSVYGGQVDLDLDCVLYGEIAYVPFDVVRFHGAELGPRAIWVNGILLAVNLLVLGVLYKQFTLCAFDPETAAAVGIPVTTMHYVLMGLVAVTTVGAFESVGAILVVAMLIVPAATAFLLSGSLSAMLLVASVASIVASFAGYSLATTVDGSIAGAMATVSGALFVGALVFSPRQGVLSRVWTRRQMRRRIEEEDLLLWAGRHAEAAVGAGFTLDEAIAGGGVAKRIPSILGRLQRAGLFAAEVARFVLTAKGASIARELIRRHRLYESYLGDLGYPPDHVHAPADRVEHYIPDALTERVGQETKFPERDPHDRPIPRVREESDQ